MLYIEKYLDTPKEYAPHAFGPVGTISNEQQMALDYAYDYCSRMTSQHSKSFYVASQLLPLHKRKAVRALYAFCRITDDIVDNPNPASNITEDVIAWRQRSLIELPQTNDLAVLAWTDARRNYRIPQIYAHQLIDGVYSDLSKVRYQNFDEVADYSYAVASTVGLMSMHIVGYLTDDAAAYAIKLGIALQMTNILRDVGEDYRMGRVYLPQDELAAFGLSDADIARGDVTPAWRKFMQFQIARTRQLYEDATPGIAMLNKDGRFSIASAANLYRAILGEIEQNDYDVFNNRAFTKKRKKARELMRTWWSTKLM